MAGKSKVRHCPQVVCDHSLAKHCLTDLQSISLRDYPGTNYFPTDIPALDFDGYESSLPGENQRTVDAVIGIGNVSEGELAYQRLLLVELRIGYESTKNLRPTKIHEKEERSRQHILSAADDVAADSHLCLVFHPDREQMMRSWLTRIKRANPCASDWEMCIPSTLLDYINYGVTDEPALQVDTLHLEQLFADACQTGDLDKIEKAWEQVHKYLSYSRLRYKLHDCEHLAEKTLESFRGRKQNAGEDADASDDLQILTELLTEDIERITAQYLTVVDS